MENTKLSPPWVFYFDELVALFAKDPQVRVTADDSCKDIKIYVDNAEKAEALAEILPPVMKYGNIEQKITVVPANAKLENSKMKFFLAAFKDNPAVAYTTTRTDSVGTEYNYIVFAGDVVHIYNDSIQALDGKQAILYENIARDVFPYYDGIFFATAEKVGEE